MTDIVINRCPSEECLLGKDGIAEFAKRKGIDPASIALATLDRTDAVLVAMMRENPEKYAGPCAHIRIVTVSDDFAWEIKRKGNFEWVAPRV